MGDLLDLEQAIMACWNLKDDLDLVAESVLEETQTQDELANTLIGLSAIHELRCQKLFEIFEKVVANHAQEKA
jgi:hypothetical protein